MPNGFAGSRTEWDKIEAPLLQVDPVFERFSKTHGLILRRNYHNWPERSLIWESSTVRKLIQIYLEDEKNLTFTIWICASKDRGAKRFWKQHKIREAVPIEAVSSQLKTLLAEAKNTLDSWNETDLQAVKG